MHLKLDIIADDVTEVLPTITLCMILSILSTFMSYRLKKVRTKGNCSGTCIISHHTTQELGQGHIFQWRDWAGRSGCISIVAAQQSSRSCLNSWKDAMITQDYSSAVPSCAMINQDIQIGLKIPSSLMPTTKFKRVS